MNKFVKSIVTLGITSALSISTVQAAKYQVIDRGDVDMLKNTYAQQENNIGEMAISGTLLYNFPVQYQYFDDEDYDNIVTLADRFHEDVHGINNIEDEDALRAGDPTANDLTWVVRYLRSLNANLQYQVVGDTVAMRNLNGQSEDFVVFDEFFPETSELTRSTIDYVNGITNDGWIYGNGSAPYTALPFTEDDGNGEDVTYWIRDFTTRGFFSADGGNTILEVLPPSEGPDVEERLRLGGESAILDISESLFAVGYASTSIKTEAIEYIYEDENGNKDFCSNEDRLKNDEPFEACVERISGNMYNTSAYKWTLNINGAVTGEELGHLVTPHVDDKREFINYAQAVNYDGVVVGFAHGWWHNNVTEPTDREARNLYAVVFKDGEVKDFTDDHTVYFDSRAYDINDAGIAVGHVKTYINGTLRSKFYYVDTNDFDSGMKMVRPDDFFNGSSSTARAINELGIIVGEGEVETHSGSNPRRTNGFMYDIATDTFTNVNDFLACDSPYTIIEARDINDLNDISASAIVKVPRKDSKGNLMLDGNGEQLVEDVVRAVTLRVIPNGEIEDCSEVEEKVERSGASISFISIISLFGFGLFRQFRNKKA